jgi:GTP-binding protein Era
MTDPKGDGERRLTPGERNELRRQERRAARRTADGTTGAPAAKRGAGSAAGAGRGAWAKRAADEGTGAGPRREAGKSGAGRGSGSGGKSEAGATPRGGTSVGGGSAVSPPSHRDGGAVGERKARTKKASAVKAHKAASVAPAVENDVYRAGFACFVGRPNAGKSTLTNAIIGQKIAITSSKPQTTRHIIRGILHKENAQLVLVDTPGLHRPRTLLGERLNDLVKEAWSEVDVIGICFPADEPIGRGDRFIAAEMAELKATVMAVVTKVDLVAPATLAKHLLAVSELYDFAEIVPVSAVSGHQVDTLVDVMIKYLPESPQLYPDDVLTEEPEQVLIGELIREAALEGVRDELPHSIAVLVEEMIDEGNLTRIFADLYVERDSQKSIVIGTRGARLKDVGVRARAQIEALLGRRIYLDLHVRVAKEWQRDPKQLRKLGF